MNNTDLLKGKTILIGKEPGNARLSVSVKINGQPKTAALGTKNSVPNSVSRCKPAEDIAHCKIDVDNSGNLTVTNLKTENVTYVNGMEIETKKIAADAKLELGIDRYPVSVGTIVETAVKIVTASCPPPPEEYSILPLKTVWEEYNGKMRDIKIRQKNIALLSSIPMVFSMLGGLIAGLAPEIREYALILTGMALLIMIYGFYRRFTDNSIDEMDKITADFQRKYVCPNDKKPCHHFMGNIPYNILRQNTKCPYCGCSLNEK
mgnify:CR=1 FL=1